MTLLLAGGLVLLWTAIGFPWVGLFARKSHLPIPLTMAVSPVVGVTAVMLSGIMLGRLGLYGFELALLGASTATAYIALIYSVRSASSSGMAYLGLLAVSGFGALVVRSRPIEFLFQTGDMGEYVNNAIALSDGRGLAGGFPPGFSSALAFSYSLGGIDALAATIPALALVTLGGVLFVGYQLGLRLVTLFVVGAFLAVQIHFLWFGMFPVSESLFAAVAMGGFALAIRSVASRSQGLAAMAGLVIGSLVFVRGDGPVTVVALALGALALVYLSRHLMRIAVSFITAAAVTSTLAFGYLIRYHHEYMVNRQLSVFVPGAVFDRLRDSFVFNGSYGSLVFWAIAGLVGSVVASTLARAIVPVKGARPAARTVAVAAAALLAVGSVTAFAALSAPATLLDAVVRAGPLFILAAVLSVFVLGLLAFKRRGVAILLFAVGIAMALPLGMHALRIPRPLGHTYYLYWDRYLYSVSIPTMVVLIIVALSVVLRNSAKRGLTSRMTMGFGWILALMLAASTILGLDQAIAVNRERMFGGAFGVLDEIASATRPSDTSPVYYVGGELPDGWFFPNTFRAIGLPLLQTFGVEFVNLPDDPFGKDPTLKETLAEIAETGQPATMVYVRDCDIDCQAYGSGVDESNSGTWRYRYRVPVNSGMSRLSSWSIPWLVIDVVVEP